MSNVRLWQTALDGPFRLADRIIDPSACRIIGPDGDHKVEPRVMALLLALASRPKTVVRRDDLIDEVWAGAAGADNSLTNTVSNLRRALEANDGVRLVETVPRLGYRLTVEPEPIAPPTAKPLTRPWATAVAAATMLVALVAATTISGLANNGPAVSERPIVALLPVVAPEELSAEAFILDLEASDAVSALGIVRQADGTGARNAAPGDTADILIQTDLWQDEQSLFAEVTIRKKRPRATVTREVITADDLLSLRTGYVSFVAQKLLAQASIGESELLAQADQSTTDDPVAFAHYARGAQNYASLTTEGVEAAIAELTQAVTVAPDFVDARVLLANALMFAGSHQMDTRDPLEAAQAAERHLLAGVRADPRSAVLHATLGDLQLCILGKTAEAAQSFETALTIDPDTDHQGLLRYHIARGERSQALSFLLRFLATHPDDLWSLEVGAQNLFSIGAFAEAEEAALEALRLDAQTKEAGRVLGLARLMTGNPQDAATTLEDLARRYPHDIRVRITLARALASLGEENDAAELAQLVLKQDPSPLQQAIAWLVMGEKERAVVALTTAFERREFGLCYLATDPVWDPLRGRDDFERVADKYRLPNPRLAPSR